MPQLMPDCILIAIIKAPQGNGCRMSFMWRSSSPPCSSLRSRKPLMKPPQPPSLSVGRLAASKTCITVLFTSYWDGGVRATLARGGGMKDAVALKVEDMR